MWDAGTKGSRFTHYSITPAPDYAFKCSLGTYQGEVLGLSIRQCLGLAGRHCSLCKVDSRVSVLIKDACLCISVAITYPSQ